MVIRNYANTFTKDYMISREVHFLVVIPASKITSLPKAINTAKRFALSMGRVRSAGSTVRDFLESGDIVMEMVGISGHDGDEFLSAMSTLDRDIFVQSASIDEITVSHVLPSSSNKILGVFGEMYSMYMPSRHFPLPHQTACNQRWLRWRSHCGY